MNLFGDGGKGKTGDSAVAGFMGGGPVAGEETSGGSYSNGLDVGEGGSQGNGTGGSVDATDVDLLGLDAPEHHRKRIVPAGRNDLLDRHGAAAADLTGVAMGSQVGFTGEAQDNGVAGYGRLGAGTGSFPRGQHTFHGATGGRGVGGLAADIVVATGKEAASVVRVSAQMAASAIGSADTTQALAEEADPSGLTVKVTGRSGERKAGTTAVVAARATLSSAASKLGGMLGRLRRGSADETERRSESDLGAEGSSATSTYGMLGDGLQVRASESAVSQAAPSTDARHGGQEQGRRRGFSLTGAVRSFQLGGELQDKRQDLLGEGHGGGASYSAGGASGGYQPPIG